MTTLYSSTVKERNPTWHIGAMHGRVRLLVRSCSAVLLAVAALPAWGLEAPTELTAWDVAFYTFVGTCVAVFCTGMALTRQYTWMTYGVYGVLIAAQLACLDGTLAYLSGGNLWMMTDAPLLVGATALGFGFIHAAMRLQQPHWLYGMRGLLLAYGALALLLIPGYFLIPSLVVLYATLNVLFLLMLVAQVLPPLTWVELSPGQHRVAIIWPVVTAIVFVGIYTVHFLGDGFARSTLDLINRGVYILHVGHLLSFASMSVMDQMRAQQAAEREAADAARRAAEAALALERSEKDFVRAQQVARRSTRQLASASHDIQQPIAALRQAMANRGHTGTQQDARRIRDAIDYLDQLAGSYLQAGNHALDQADAELKRGPDGRERVDTNVVIGTVVSMFEQDAVRAGVELLQRGSNRRLHVSPLALTRCLANMVNNAISHAQASRIVLCVRSRGGRAQIEVRDNGRGMSPEMAAGATELRARSDDSDGSGLGLAIVAALAEEHGWRLSLRSAPGAGTTVGLGVPCG